MGVGVGVILEGDGVGGIGVLDGVGGIPPPDEPPPDEPPPYGLQHSSGLLIESVIFINNFFLLGKIISP